MRNFLLSKLRFNPIIFESLERKCRNETKIGLWLNLLFYVLYRVAVRLKEARSLYQKSIRDTARGIFAKAFPEQKVAPPVMPWDLPLPLKMKRSSSKFVLIVAELSIPQCTRYRVQQKIEALLALGYDVQAISFTDRETCFRLLPFAATVIFYPTPYWDTTKELLSEAKRLHIPTFYDIDDLVFDLDEYRAHPVLKTLPTAEARNLLNGAESYRDCLAACDFGISSTQLLATYFRKYIGGKVYVLENALDSLSLRCAQNSEKAPKGNHSQVVVGYGSGTKSHDEDFALLEGALVRILNEFKNVSLAIHGYLQLGKEFEPFTHRIFRIPFLSAEQYLDAVARFDINLAPLVEGKFNDAKSNIKFLEASVCGVPTVASPRVEFLSIIKHEENGYLASNEDEWYQALKELVQSGETRKRIGAKAKEDVLAAYHPTITTKKLSEILDDSVSSTEQIKTRPKLMFVNCLYAPFSFGGATIVVERLAKALSASFDIVIVTTHQMHGRATLSTLRYESEGNHVYSIRLQDPPIATKEYRNQGLSEIFSRILDQECPDIVHFHAVQQMGIDIIDKTKHRGINTVVTMHDAWWFCEKQFMITSKEVFCGQTGTIDLKICSECTKNADFTYRRFRELTMNVLNQVDLILTPSTYYADLIKANVPDPEKVRVNSNGIVFPKSTVSPRKLNEKQYIRFAFIGGAGARHKGYFLIKDVFERMTCSNYELIFTDIHRKIGGQPLREPLTWNLKGKASVVEPYDQETIDSFFENVDVLLCPSLWHESFGLAVREAILRNTWVVASRSGGYMDIIIDNKNGNLFDIDDAVGFQKCVEKLLENPSTLENYDAPNKEVISSFEDQAKNLEEIYLKMAKSPKTLEPSTFELDRVRHTHLSETVTN